MSNVAREFAAIDVEDAIAAPAKFRVKVAGEEEVLQTTIFVTIVVVEAGVVYRVELLVLAAPLNIFFAVVATISMLP